MLQQQQQPPVALSAPAHLAPQLAAHARASTREPPLSRVVGDQRHTQNHRCGPAPPRRTAAPPHRRARAGAAVGAGSRYGAVKPATNCQSLTLCSILCIGRVLLVLYSYSTTVLLLDNGWQLRAAVRACLHPPARTAIGPARQGPGSGAARQDGRTSTSVRSPSHAYSDSSRRTS